MTQQTIESQDLTIGNVFNDFYVVPSYQREYVWEEKQVEQLFTDIMTEFSSDNRDQNSEYFIGSIVVCPRPDDVYELIDGQQRMTTAYIFLCAVRDHLKKIVPKSAIETLKKQIAATDVDNEGKDVFRYRVSLQYEDSGKILEVLAKESEMGDRADIESISQTTRSIQNIVNAYNIIRSFIRNEFGEDEVGLRKFYAYFTKNVKLIRVKTISVAHALKVFETINDRGVGLDSMDLLKNLMFMQAKAEDFNKLKDKWKELVDTLYEIGEKPLRFLRYYIFARYDVDRLKEDEIYEWFVKNEQKCGYKAKPQSFVEDLLKAAKAYAMFINGKDPSGESNRYLSNIQFMSGAARQHLILLLAGQYLTKDLFNELCKHIENLFFAYIITREPTKEFERSFAQWTTELRQVKDKKSLSDFLDKRFRPAKETLSKRFLLAMRELAEWSLQKYRMRYVLAKLTQYVNERAWGSSGAEANLDTFLNSKIDVEHILPQSPTKDMVSTFDKPSLIGLYIIRLGNLALIEKTLNSSIRNEIFGKKKKAYSQSKFLLTKSLAEKISVGTDTALNRAMKDIDTYEIWDSKSIESRQGMLARLAQQVWEMPVDIKE